MKTDLLREAIAEIIKEGNVIDLTQRREQVNTQDLIEYINVWRDCMSNAEGALEIIEELLDEGEKRMLRSMMDVTIHSPSQKALRYFLQETINKRTSPDED